MFSTLIRGVIIQRGQSNNKVIDLLKSYTSKVVNYQKVPKHFFSSIKKNFGKSKHKKDGVPKSYLMIFDNMNGRNIRIAAVSLTLAGCIIPSGLYLVEDLVKNWTKDTVTKLLMLNILLILVTAMVFVGLMYQRLMLRIYKNGDTNQFICIVPKWVFLQKSIPVHLNDIKPTVSASPRARFLFGTVKIHNRPYFLSSEYFALPKYFNEIHGFPIKK